MRIAFFGCTAFSERILKALLQCSTHDLVAIFSIPREFSISYSQTPVVNSNYANLKVYATNLKIPFYEVNSVKGQKTSDYEHLLKALNLDVILVMGWYFMVPESTRNLARNGAWGIHASLLPNYAGGAPLVWAMIEGESKTGVTLFMLSDGVDDGDIIEQVEISIEENETIKDVYEKATIASEEIIKRVFGDSSYVLKPKPQDKSKIKIYPQRSPDDGKIDWDWEEAKIDRFIRAQTKPYPGAWTIIGDKKVTIWEADITTIVGAK